MKETLRVENLKLNIDKILINVTTKETENKRYMHDMCRRYRIKGIKKRALQQQWISKKQEKKDDFRCVMICMQNVMIYLSLACTGFETDNKDDALRTLSVGSTEPERHRS